MGWKGIAIGGSIGGLMGGALGALLGAAIGEKIEKALTTAKGPPSARPYGRQYEQAQRQRREMIFCASSAAMLAKMAKADGHVTADEIASVEAAFERLGFSPVARDYAISVFRRAKDDAHTIYEYADEFAAAVDSVEVRELFYGLLWDLACADGAVDGSELAILERMPRALRIRPAWFAFFRNERLGGDPREPGRETSSDSLSDAYALLGVSPSDDDGTVRRAYREKAKKYHPDRLRAEGLPEEMIGRATETMARINGAWDLIKAARRMS